MNAFHVEYKLWHHNNVINRHKLHKVNMKTFQLELVQALIYVSILVYWTPKVPKHLKIPSQRFFWIFGIVVMWYVFYIYCGQSICFRAPHNALISICGGWIVDKWNSLYEHWNPYYVINEWTVECSMWIFKRVQHTGDAL